MSVSMVIRINIDPKYKHDEVVPYISIRLRTEQHLYIKYITNKKVFYISQRVTTFDYFETYKDVYTDLGIIDKLEEDLRLGPIKIRLGPIKNILFKDYTENELNDLITLWKLKGYQVNIFN